MKEQTINKEDLVDIENLVDDKDNRSILSKLLNKDFMKITSINALKNFYYKIEDLYFELKKSFEKVEIAQYISNTLEIEDLKEIYQKKKLYNKYPNLDLDKLKELFDNPISKLKSPAYKSYITYDKVVSRKYVVAILQMVFNNMDLVVAFCGREGTGKTTASTQDSYLVYYLLKEIGIVDYDYNLKGIMYYNLKGVIDGFNKHSMNPFRIFVLDEGNELNRKNWGNPLVELFFQKLRRERKHLRIIFINLPQLGELIPSITLSRVNFVFQLEMRGNIRTKLAEKGDCSFFIIPRFNTIYSYFNKKNLQQDYVINELGKLLDDKKKYLQLLPKYLCIHKFNRSGIWSFNEEEYDKLSKEANEQFSTNSLTLTKAETFYLGKHLNLKKMGIKPNTKAYHILANLRNKKLKLILKNTEEFEHYEKTDEHDEFEE